MTEYPWLLSDAGIAAYCVDVSEGTERDGSGTGSPIRPGSSEGRNGTGFLGTRPSGPVPAILAVPHWYHRACHERFHAALWAKANEGKRVEVVRKLVAEEVKRG